MPNSKNKGNAFEREICSALSNWWVPGRNDIFWRTASSGGRATQRAKRGTKTKNHDGDITATDPIGQPLLDVVTLEVKRGYNKDSFADLLDKPKKSVYLDWIKKAQISKSNAGSKTWLLIIKRDRRETIVIGQAWFLESVCFKAPKVCFDMPIAGQRLICLTLKSFFDYASPQNIIKEKELHDSAKNTNNRRA